MKAAEKGQKQRDKELVRNARKKQDPLAGSCPFSRPGLATFLSFKRDEAEFTIEYSQRASLPESLLQDFFHITKAAMEGIYQSSWPEGWSDSVKLAELSSDEAKYLGRFVLIPVVRTKSGQLAAFAHFRFEYDDQAAAYGVPGRPILYLYEIQLVSAFRRMGLGKHLMRSLALTTHRLLEMVALKNQLDCVMLTVQNENHSAALFYKSLSYKTDPSDPSQFIDSIPQLYTILSKSLRRK